MYIFFAVIFKDKEDWPGMIFVFVLSVSQTFGIGFLF